MTPRRMQSSWLMTTLIILVEANGIGGKGKPIYGGGSAADKDSETYKAYTKQQKAKLDRFLSSAKGAATVRAIDATWSTRLPAAYNELNLKNDVPGRTVLCLGARLGGEVRAFTSMNALAIGIDLNPGPNNPYVLPGDFHHLQFANHVFDIVYTNVIGHAWDLKALGSEICRVLKPSGVFHLDARLDASNETTIAKAAASARSGRGFETISYTKAAHLIARMGMKVLVEPKLNFVVCQCN